jgi:hypothetical protein
MTSLATELMSPIARVTRARSSAFTYIGAPIAATVITIVSAIRISMSVKPASPARLCDVICNPFTRGVLSVASLPPSTAGAPRAAAVRERVQNWYVGYDGYVGYDRYAGSLERSIACLLFVK